MSSPGPRRKPTALRIAEGTAHRAPNRDKEPAPPKGQPAQPSQQDADSQLVWRQLMSILEASGVLTKADGFPLERYCKMLVLWREAAAKVDEDGVVYHSGDLLKSNPSVRLVLDLNAALIRIEQEFGMTPAARTRIQVDIAEKRKDALQDFLDDKSEPRTNNG